ncbi:unnamed protein product [Prorocentrum cordatum]|uniref:Uncharacterized protein n=1 Tax=Prorocentrum cordatum TaxID=2364126 RepID=A0ABN9XMD0_9DINO|nr:unnamed protein product [Polarella glacialis]
MDALQCPKRVWAALIYDNVNVNIDENTHYEGESPLEIDAKALYDAAKKESITSFQDKRSGIELQRDPTYTAAKKKTKEERQETIMKSKMETSSATKAGSPLKQLAVFATCYCKPAATYTPEFDYHTEYKYYYDEIAKCSWFSGSIWNTLTFTMIGMAVATPAVYCILREFTEHRDDSSVKYQTETSNAHDTTEETAMTSIDKETTIHHKETTIHLKKTSSNHKQVRRRTVGAQSMFTYRLQGGQWRFCHKMNGFKRADGVSVETTEPNQWQDGYDRAADDSPKGCSE